MSASDFIQSGTGIATAVVTVGSVATLAARRVPPAIEEATGTGATGSSDDRLGNKIDEATAVRADIPNASKKVTAQLNTAIEKGHEQHKDRTVRTGRNTAGGAVSAVKKAADIAVGTVTRDAVKEDNQAKVETLKEAVDHGKESDKRNEK